MRMSLRMIVIGIVIGLATLALAGAALAATEFPLVVSDTAFSGPDQVTAGLVKVTVKNEGKEPHSAGFVKFKEGKTVDDLTAVLKANPQDFAGALALVDLMGGTNNTPPGQTAEAWITWTPGNYAVLDFSGVAKGLIKSFKVVEGTAGVVAEPQADVDATLKDFQISMPSELSAGKHTFKITNQGPQQHELIVAHLAPGKTGDDLLKFIESAGPNSTTPPPIVGQPTGFSPVAAGVVGYQDFDFTPGSYVAICFLPDPATGKPHAALGMVTPFTVPGAEAQAQTPQTLPTSGGVPYGISLLALAVGAALLSAGLLVGRVRRTRN